MLLLDGQVHHDTHAVPMGKYVSEVGNYVIATPSDLGNYMSADTLERGFADGFANSGFLCGLHGLGEDIRGGRLC